ncbi:Putative pre-16S rRNA nuclease [Fundidesulfovibrio magnetotacticus]|uniref:Putative pre-16S rRNA nuclease n=1 Tax=Fundidesulfovibrio magnetotacticus TaxID=2730080 RepID=A0A6V8LTW5_9BACT|nr:Holliday junction resolvase RuvX [Fundidesulfovibrio magnetotacticus]GFK94031.1 Putative pre-16S rRNA nuclease [Fundidesulfovibrio magnetotacticus]
MKTLCIDYGLKRVGLAVSDPGGAMAFALDTLPGPDQGGRDALFAALARVIAEQCAEEIVVGYPEPAEGRYSLSARRAANFAASLARRTALPVKLMDETLSSEEALERLRQAGVKPGRVKELLDRQAAALILETYLAAPASARAVAATFGSTP